LEYGGSAVIIHFSEKTKFLDLRYEVRHAYFRHELQDDLKFASDVSVIVLRGFRGGNYSGHGLAVSKKARQFVHRINDALDDWAKRAEKLKRLDRVGRAAVFGLLIASVADHVAHLAAVPQYRESVPPLRAHG